MPLASFIDQTWVAPGIVLGYVGLIFVASVAGAGRRRPLGVMLVAGLFFVLILLAFADWMIDDVF